MARRDTKPEVVVLVRHGHAGRSLVGPRRDRARRLTRRGRKQARRAGEALVRMGLSPVDVWTSELPRAIETADEALDAVGARPTRRMSPALAPHARPATLTEALGKRPLPHGQGDEAPVLWLVGHEPHLTALLSHWTGTPRRALSLEKGAVAVVELPEGSPRAGGFRLIAVLQPENLKALRRR